MYNQDPQHSLFSSTSLQIGHRSLELIAGCCLPAILSAGWSQCVSGRGVLSHYVELGSVDLYAPEVIWRTSGDGSFEQRPKIDFKTYGSAGRKAQIRSSATP